MYPLELLILWNSELWLTDRQKHGQTDIKVDIVIQASQKERKWLIHITFLVIILWLSFVDHNLDSVGCKNWAKLDISTPVILDNLSDKLLFLCQDSVWD